MNIRAVTLLATASLVVLLAACVEKQQLAQSHASGRAVSADDLLVVDCLLPGQVRKLGSQMTYVSARRPIQTTVQDCEIRGGEYVAYDRGSYASALGFWMPLAQQGDPDAQNKVGELFERGVTGAPDYEQAGFWYRRAADQGLERAQINLAFLYEKGLGVPQDQRLALEWYRKASKMPEAVMIDRASYDAQLAQITELKANLERSRQQLIRAKKELRDAERAIRREQKRLERALEQQAGGTLDAAAQRRLADAQRKLEQQSRDLAQRQAQILALESTAKSQQDRLLLLEAEGASLREQLAAVRSELERSKQELATNQAQLSDSRAELELTRNQLAELPPVADEAAQRQVQGLREQLRASEQALVDRQRAAAELDAQVAELTRRLNERRADDAERVASLQQTLASVQAKLEQARSEEANRMRDFERLQAEFAAQRARLAEADMQRDELSAQLQEREARLAEQERTVERLRSEAEQWQVKLQQLQAKGQSEAVALKSGAASEAETVAPVIQLIDPPLVATRGEAANRVPIKRGAQQRSLVGQVTAPAGLFALTLNGARISPNDKGLFSADVPIVGSETPVNLVAIDKRGQKTQLGLSLVLEDDTRTLVAKAQNPFKDVALGQYHALVIGNRDYQHLPDLDTSANDARDVAKLLEEKFGYTVSLLIDASRYEILSELNRLRQTLTEKDNLLVYYAGHGELDRVNLRGHWLPVDAEAQNTANWISNVAITDILNAMSVRHVLMVADSCYSGTLTRSSLAQLEAGQSDEARVHWLKTLLKMRSRLALTSGGLAPVLDGGGGQHSVFARAFLGVLRDMDDVMEGQKVYRDVSARVAYEANRYQVEQVPEYAPIKFAGHESGDFLFIPRGFLSEG